jgi:hypothetical protein
MAYQPYSPQISCPYYFTGVQQIGSAIITQNATFNDPNDANYVGDLTEVTGLEMPDIRESAEDRVQGDGGIQGDSFFARRAVVFSGTITGHSTMYEREARLDKLRRMMSAGMRKTAQGGLSVHWQNLPTASNPALRLNLMPQGPLRVSGGWIKNFTFGVVAPDPVIQSYQPSTAGPALPGVSLVTENVGNWPSSVSIDIKGPVTNPTVTNLATGDVLRFTSGFFVPALMRIIINTADRTITKVPVSGYAGNATFDAFNLSTNIDYIGSTWPEIVQGVNNFTLTGSGTTAATSLTVNWYSAWL